MLRQAQGEAPLVPTAVGVGDLSLGVRFLPRPTKAVVARALDFVQAAAAIAGDGSLDRATKRARLAAMEAALRGDAARSAPEIETARALRRNLDAAGIAIDHARHLLQASQWDAQGRRCRSWSELLAHCRYAAAPIGRIVLDLHREDREAYRAAEALCAALRILDRLRHGQADWRDHERLAVPLDWLKEAGLQPDALFAPRCSRELRRVLDRLLDGVDQLHRAAAPLPGLLRDRGLQRAAATSLAASQRLAAKLRRRDPLRRTVSLSRLDRALCLARGHLLRGRGA